MSDFTPVLSEMRDSAETRRGWPWPVVLRIAIIAVLVVLVYRPAISSMVYIWQNDGNWSHGWLVPVFSLYFLYVHREELLGAKRKPNYLGLLILIGALGMYYYSFIRGFRYPQLFSILPCLLGLVLLMGGWQVLKVTWFPIAFLIFAIPLPRTQYFYLTLPLRRIASQVAGAVLNFIPDVYTQVQGVVIDYDYAGRTGSLNVEEACSGMRLIMAFCSLGVAMAYLGDRPLWQRIVMILFCVPIAVLCNTLRVLMTGILHVSGHQDWAQGTAHELLGLVMLPIALGLFALVGYVLKHLVVEEPEPDAVPAGDGGRS